MIKPATPQRDADSTTAETDDLPLTPKENRERRKEQYLKIGKAITSYGQEPRPPAEVTRSLRELAQRQHVIWDKTWGGVYVNPWGVRKSGGSDVLQILTQPRLSKLERRSLEYEEEPKCQT